jgi:DNA-binding SARP family transcriptional activator
MKALRSFGRLLFVAMLVAAIGLLFASRPVLPKAGSMVSARRAEDILILTAWLGALLLALGLLYRIARPRRHRLLPAVSSIQHLHPIPRTTPVAPAVYSTHALPIVLKKSEARSDCRDEQAEMISSFPSGSRLMAVVRRVENAASISLLGPVEITGGRKHPRGLRGPTKDLLCYLALHHAGAHRDQIIDALWPHQSPEQARKRLWRAATDARGHFGEAALVRDGEHYRIDRAKIDVDVDTLHKLLLELKGTESADERLPLLEHALALYKAEPLSGSDLPWAQSEQRHLHAVHIDLLEQVGRTRLSLGDPAAGLANAERGLALEPYNEQLARLAMEAEARLGLRSALINRYERLAQLLEEQLGLKPHRETRQLFRRLVGQESLPSDVTRSHADT